MNNLFEIPSKSINLNHLDLKALNNFCLSQVDDSLHNSNEGGHHSKYFDLKLPLLKPLCEDILNISKQFCVEIGVEQVTHIQNMWSILNKQGHYNREHIHPNSFFSGVFYPGDEYVDNCGALSFQHPAHKEMNYDWDYKQKNYNTFNSLTMNIKPVRGMLMIFPSYLTHYVNINRSNTDRLVISFNLK